MAAKSILVLNGAPRRNGKTQALVDAFSQGACEAGHIVQEVRLADLTIHGCRGCLGAGRHAQSPCVQKDDMETVYTAFADCDVVVFASPVYFWTISGTLKTAADRLYAELECLGYAGFTRQCVLLMTADGMDYSQALTWYRTYERNLGWTNRGEVLGKGKVEEAKRLGASL